MMMTRSRNVVRFLTVGIVLLGAGAIALCADNADAARKVKPKRTAAKKAVVKPIPSWNAHLQALQRVAGRVGVQMASLPGNEILWEHEASTPMVPASVTKVLTSFAALKQLGPYHHFHTSVWSLSGPDNDGVLKGDVWIKSEGDPFLLTEKAWTLALRLRERGVKTIKGKVYVDNSFFSPGGEKICLDGRCARPYNPVVSGTALDYNTITFRFFPGEGVGSPARVENTPPCHYVRVENGSKTGSKKSRTTVSVWSEGVGEDGREKYRVTGTMPVHAVWGAEYHLNVGSPAHFNASAFKGLLEEVGITVEGPPAGNGTVPPGAMKLANYESPPLGDLLFGLNRYSNNFMAEMLLRSVGAFAKGPPGSARKGIAAIQETMLEIGIPNEEIRLDSGSGLSRTCYASPRAFTQLLVNAYRDFSIAPEFISSLAMNSKEGTLKRRIRSSGVTVRGKTGTLRDVVGFTGYVTQDGKNVYAVTVLLNQVNSLWAARRALDDFLQHLPMLAKTKL